MIEKTRHPSRSEIPLLNLQINERKKIAQWEIIHNEAVELMSVNCQVSPPAKLPGVFLEDFNAYQMRHDFRKTLIMIPFHPNHLDVALGVGELADVTQELPVFFL
jgi:hypothetical protein